MDTTHALPAADPSSRKTSHTGRRQPNPRPTMPTTRRIFAGYFKRFLAVLEILLLVKESVSKMLSHFYKDLHYTTLRGLHRTRTGANFMECIHNTYIEPNTFRECTYAMLNISKPSNGPQALFSQYIDRNTRSIDSNPPSKRQCNSRLSSKCMVFVKVYQEARGMKSVTMREKLSMQDNRRIKKRGNSGVSVYSVMCITLNSCGTI